MKKLFQNYQLPVFVILFSFFTVHQTHAQRYPAVFDPATIPFNGTNGFVIPGLDAVRKLGNEDVQFIGDINNDGIEDFAIGNGNEFVGALNLAGRAYIIFGSTTAFPTPFDLTSLNGTNGFVVEAVAASERRGSTIAGPGDVNGDGIDDLIIGSSSTNQIVLYGATSFPSLITVNDINGSNGFLINAPGGRQVATLGDVNGDGISDFIIGTPHWSGQSWVIFGRSSNYPALLDVSWLNGINGFRISDFEGSRPAYFVGGAGDINNDGYNDILIGNWASSFDAPGEISYTLFGKNTPFDALVDIEAVNGTDGFLIDNQGNAFLTYVGLIGDINDDGIDDCFSENNIIFGSSTAFPDSLFMSDLNGSNGFVLENYVLFAAPTGDLNLDGIDDFIVASSDHYVVYGKTGGFSATFDLSTLDGINGFQIPNVASSGNGGRNIDGGKDINGDGFSDFIFGDRNFGSTGRVYVVFGGDFVAPTITCPANQELTCADTVIPDYTSFATATDTEDPNPAITQSPVVGSTFTNGITITLTATDASGNTSSCTFIVNQLADTTNPVITCPSNQSLAFGATVPDYTSLATATDNCGSPAITQSPIAGAAFTDGMTITLTATDGSGNTSNCTFIINKLPDTTAPVITCPANQELTCTDTTIPDYTNLATATDAEDSNPAITQSPVAGAAFTDGMVITLTATDASGNASNCNFIINKLPDTTAPVITCPGNQELACNDTVIPDYANLATVTDAEDPNPTITQSPVAGSDFVDGMTIILTATDVSGNASDCSFTITVNAIPEKPTISVAENILTSSSTVGNQWFMDGTAIDGATQQNYTISTGSAVYTVQVTVEGCISNMSDPVVITGLNKSIAGEIFHIWPNPVNNQIFVELPNNYTIYSYVIINSMGAIIKSNTFKRTELVQNFDVTLNELRSGIYTISVATDRGVVHAKFVKK